MGRAIAHSFPVTFDVRQGQAFDFAITATPTNISTRVGQPAATFTLDIDPGAAVFPNDVTLTSAVASPACGTSGNCGPCPPVSTCAFSQAQIQSGSSRTHITFSVLIAAPVPGSSKLLLMAPFTGFPLAGILWLRRNKRSSRSKRIARSFLAFTVTLSCISCGSGLQGNRGGGGGSGSPGTPISTYNITLTATSTSGSPVHFAVVTLTVTP